MVERQRYRVITNKILTTGEGGGKEGKSGGNDNIQNETKKELQGKLAENRNKVMFESRGMEKIEKEIEEFNKSVRDEVTKLRLANVEIMKAKIVMKNKVANLKQTLTRLERIDFLEKRQR